MLELMVFFLWQDFAQSGLRTLCLAVKDIDPQLYEQWRVKHHEARYGHLYPLSIHTNTHRYVLPNIKFEKRKKKRTATFSVLP